MARIIDYQFDTIEREKVINAGTSGSDNDAVMYTGQALEALDADNEKIITDIIPFTQTSPSALLYKTFICDFVVPDTSGKTPVVYYFWDDNTNAGVYVYNYYGDDLLYARIGTSRVQLGDYRGQKITLTQTLLDDGTHNIYINGTLAASGTSDTTFDNPPTDGWHLGILGRESDDKLTRGGVIGRLVMLDVSISSDDALYDYNNKHAVISSFITSTDDPNFSFSYSNIKHIIPFDEGSGDKVHDIVTGAEYTIINHKTDNTDWSNADEAEWTHQKAMFYKDDNHNPHDDVPAHTIVFIDYPVSSVTVEGGDTTEDDSGVTVS